MLCRYVSPALEQFRYFLLLRQKAFPTRAIASTENFQLFIQWHETAIFREWIAKKRACTAPFSRFIIFPLFLYRFTHISFGKTLYNLAKLPTFAKLYRVLPDCMGVLPKGITFAKSYEVLPKGITFAKLYPTFAKRFILFGESTPEQKFTHSRM